MTIKLPWDLPKIAQGHSILYRHVHPSEREYSEQDHCPNWQFLKGENTKNKRSGKMDGYV